MTKMESSLKRKWDRVCDQLEREKEREIKEEMVNRLVSTVRFQSELMTYTKKQEITKAQRFLLVMMIYSAFCPVSTDFTFILIGELLISDYH